MKKINLFVTGLLLTVAVLFSSCLKNNDDGERSEMFVVKVINTMMGGISFEDLAGTKLYVTSQNLLSVESQYNINFSNMNMAAIYGSYNINDIEEGQNGINITLLGGMSIDETVEVVDTPGASNDSISDGPIIGLNKLLSNGKEITVLDDRLLVTGVNYYLYQKVHYVTLVYYPEETTADSEEITLYLRHNKNGEKSFSNTSSQYFWEIPYFYYKCFDISRVLQDYRGKTNNSKVKINVEAEIDESSGDGEGSLKTYSLDYTFKN